MKEDQRVAGRINEEDGRRAVTGVPDPPPGDTNNLLTLLRSFDLLGGLSDEELEEALHSIRVRSFRQGDVVLREQDANLFMYLIVSGRVKVVRSNEDGREMILAIHDAGSYFGEVSLIDGRATSAAVVAVEESCVAILSQEDFRFLLQSQHQFLWRLLQTFCDRIRHSNTALEIMSSMSAEQRVRILLLTLCGRCGVAVTGGYRLEIPLTHQEIAGMTGLARETVSRVLGQMREGGLVRIDSKRRIFLSDGFVNDIGLPGDPDHRQAAALRDSLRGVR